MHNIIKKGLKIVIPFFLSIVLILGSFVTGQKGLAATSTKAQRNYIANNWILWGQGDDRYNCLAYALGITDRWVWPWLNNPSKKTVKKYLENKGYVVSTSASLLSNISDNRRKIVAYSNGDGITHFARAYTAKTIVAKWGSLEVFYGNKYASYTNNVYGQPCLYAYYRYK